MARPTLANTVGDGNSPYFRMGKRELKALASGRSKKAQAAQAELDRRRVRLSLKQAEVA